MKFFPFKIFVPVIFVLAAFCSCNNSADLEDNNSLELVSKFIINVPEPSDLTFNYGSRDLWTVSDSTNKIYLISRSGEVIKQVESHAKDAEGITYDNNLNFVVVQEKKAEVVITDTTGKEINKEDIDLPSSYSSGLEGITYNKYIDRFFIINEKNPTVILELDNSFNILSTKELKISTDLSAIFYEDVQGAYWVLSDESKLLAKYDTDFNLLALYSLPVKQAEGVAVLGEYIYIVSDNENALYVFRRK